MPGARPECRRQQLIRRQSAKGSVFSSRNFTTVRATPYSCRLALHTQSLYINGEFVPAQATGAIEVIDPATGDVLSRVPDAGAADVDRAVAAGPAAFDD